MSKTPAVKSEKKPKVRATTAEDRRDIKQATRMSLRMVRANKFAMVTRYEETELSRFGSEDPEFADKFMHVDVLGDLQLELPRGVPAPLLEVLAALGGLKLVPIDGDDEGGEGAVLDDIGRVAKEGGEGKVASLKAIGSTCLDIVRTAVRETGEARDEWSTLHRKHKAHERRLLRRGAA